MLEGSKPSVIDAKGRMVIPQKFRSEFGDKVIITLGLLGCLYIFDIPKWEELATKLSALSFAESLDIKYLLIGNKEELELDKQQRILIPTPLRQLANLDKEVLVVGQADRAEIWGKEAWFQRNRALTNSQDIIAKMEALRL